MATDLRMKRVMDRLVPADKVSADELADLPANVILRCQITRPRNARHHGKYFALVSAIFPHQSGWPTIKALHDQLKMAVGFSYEARDILTGEVRTYPDSIAFDNLDQAGFEELYPKIVDVVLTRVIPGVGRRDLEDQVLSILEGRK